MFIGLLIQKYSNQSLVVAPGIFSNATSRSTAVSCILDSAKPHLSMFPPSSEELHESLTLNESSPGTLVVIPIAQPPILRQLFSTSIKKSCTASATSLLCSSRLNVGSRFPEKPTSRLLLLILIKEFYHFSRPSQTISRIRTERTQTFLTGVELDIYRKGDITSLCHPCNSIWCG